ncbi:MAG TPA: anti-sigma factor [Caulobacteraceae bacterium]|jgi:hypothetical protein
MSISDQDLMAYVDGECDTAACAAVEAAAAVDPEIAARIERQRTLRRMIGRAHAEVVDEAVPERLLAAARGGPARVIDLAVARAKRSGPRAWAMVGGMAACLAAGLIVGQALNLGGEPLLVAAPAGGLSARGGLERVLTDQLATRQTGQAVQIGISFRSTDGRYCRTFRIRQRQDLAGLACREPKAWVVRVVTATPGPREATGMYSVASSPLPAPVAEMVDQMIAGQPLDAAGESTARAKGWR